MWITGQVVDERGRALRDVTIKASGLRASGRRTAVTNAQGQYVLQDVRPGVYTLTFARSGFSTLERKADVPRTYVTTVNARLQAQPGEAFPRSFDTAYAPLSCAVLADDGDDHEEQSE